MAYELRQELKLSQSLVMTPQLQQAIKLLQLSRLELLDEVKEEIETNPVLECSAVEDGAGLEPEQKAAENSQELDWQTYMESSAASMPKGGINFSDRTDEDFFDNLSDSNGGLLEHLTHQLNLSGLSPEELAIGVFIVGNIDNDGYLRLVDEKGLGADEEEALTIKEIEAETGAAGEDIERILKVIQDFEPAGVGARTTRECLLLQARYLPERNTVVEAIIKGHLSDLANKNYKTIASKLSISFDEVLEAAKAIVKHLNPLPGSGFGDDESQTVIPDVFITKVDGRYVVALNDNGLPMLKVSPYYRDLAKKTDGMADGTKEYIQERFRSALWLIKSVHQRRRTIFNVVESIVGFQREFLDKGVRYLKPLTLRDVAEEIGVHESTVSRVTSNKYAETPRGTFRLKYFFSTSMSGEDGSDMSVEYIKSRIQKLIDSEDSLKPLSDMKIVEGLKADGIIISRRTATKYRESLGVLSSHKRKSYF